jgi:hypothetical protein
MALFVATCTLDSGVVSNSGSQLERIFVGTTSPDCIGNNPWIRLHFSAVTLSGSPGVDGSYLVLISPPPNGDGAQQTLDAVSVAQWRNTSAYFRGNTVQVELWAYPGTGSNRITVDQVAGAVPLSVACFLNSNALCDGNDDRVPTADPRNARFRHPSKCPPPASVEHHEQICSAFLIDNGSNWLLSAGHCCQKASTYISCPFGPIVEFGVPLSTVEGWPLPAPPQNQFPVDWSSHHREIHGSSSPGQDWCFFGVYKNSNTHLTPAQSRGATYRVPTTIPSGDDSSLRVTGHGNDYDNLTTCLAQQTATGPYVALDGSIVHFAVDAQNSSSGGPVESVCGKAYAIVNDGLCGTTGANVGTALTYAPLVDALTPNIIDGGTKEPLGVAADCNGNGIKDWCDVSCGATPCTPPNCGASAADNCNNNLIPDACEPNVDCNGNGARDLCEVGSPAAPDCNTNGVPDGCDLVSGFSADCNCNGVPDDCDICVATMVDANNNWVADQCEGKPVAVAPQPSARKSRSLSLANTNSGSTAIRVKLIDLENPVPPNNNPVGPCCPPGNFIAFDTALNSACAGGENLAYRCTSGADCPGGTCPAAVGCTAEAAQTPGGVGGCMRWVGPPLGYLESNDNPGLGNYKAARLQCAPHYEDWISEGLFHVIGAEIVPSSTYEVQVFGSSCMGAEATCANVSCPLTMTTARAGDVAAPFQGPPPLDCPNALDVTAAINKFRNVGSPFPTKAVFQVQPNFPDPNADTNAIDIVTVVDNCRGFGYTYSGPCKCPAFVTCNQIACSGDGNCKLCDGGPHHGVSCGDNCECCSGPCSESSPCTDVPAPVCRPGTCVKTCTSGPRTGQPCNNNLNCGSCIDGPPTGPGAKGIPCDANADCASANCGVGVCPTGATPGFCRDTCGRCTTP